MSSTYSSAVDALDTLTDNLNYWTPSIIEITVATSLYNPEPQVINLVETLGFNTKNKGLDPSAVYWLPEKFDQNTPDHRRVMLAPTFALACRQAGFRSILKGWEASRSQGDPSSGYCMFTCNRYRYHKDSESELSSKFKTNRPLKSCSETCKFKFACFWSFRHHRWYLPKKQAGCASHNGHPKHEVDQVGVIASTIGLEEDELAQQLAGNHVSMSLIASIIESRIGVGLDYKQVYRRNKERLKRQLLLDFASIFDSTGEPRPDENVNHTPAEKLIWRCSANPKITYTVAYGQYDDNRLTICQRSKRPGQPYVDIVNIDPSELEDPVDSAATFAEKVRDALSIQGTGQILLGFAWTTDEATRKFNMFPEFTCSDVTMKSNAEKRPLLLLCGKDSYNKAFTHTWAFLPSQSKWVFDWFFGFAVPKVHNLYPGTLTRNFINITDEDPQACSSFRNLCGGFDSWKVYPLSRHRLCAFHKLNRNFTRGPELYPLITQRRNADIGAGLEFDMITKWLWAFIKQYETQAEADHSMALLSRYLEEDDKDHHGTMGAALKEKVVEFVSNKFQTQRHYLFGHVFHSTQTFDNVTTGVNEAENRSIKITAGGVTPNDALDTSHSKIASIDRRRHLAHERKAAYEYTAKISNPEMRECSSVGGVTSHCEDMLQVQYLASTKYLVFQPSENEYYVKYNRQPSEVPSSPLETRLQSDETRLYNRCQWYIPKYERTRVVTLVTDKGNQYAQCSCHFPTRNSMCCRHIYAILLRPPQRNDVGIRWWLSYSLYYHRDKAVTAQLDKIADQQGPGTHVLPSDIRPLNEEDLEYPIHFFTRSLDTVLMVGKNYWTESLRNPHKPVIGHGLSLLDGGFMQPAGMTTEVHLSQMTQDSLSYPNSGSDDEQCDPFGEEEPNRFTDDADYETPLSKSVSTHSQNMPLYNAIHDCMEVQGESLEFTNMLHAFHGKLLKNQANRRRSKSNSKKPPPPPAAGMLSLSQTDTSRKCIRMKPVSSPSWYRGNRGNGGGQQKKRKAKADVTSQKQLFGTL